jgi:hypothetical protein
MLNDCSINAGVRDEGAPAQGSGFWGYQAVY